MTFRTNMRPVGVILAAAEEAEGHGSGGASPTVRRRALAAALRRLRHAAGLNLEEAASALEVSAPTISRYETGVRIPRARDVRELCRLYGVSSEETRRLVSLVGGAKESGWWEEYSEVDLHDGYSTLIGLEASATAIDTYANVLVPGLLQTSEYASAVYRDVVSPLLTKPLSEHDIMKLVEIRMKRQQRLVHGSGLRLTAIIEQVALQRPIGSLTVMIDQVSHLLNLSEKSLISLQVLPHSTGSHPGQAGSFAVLTLQQEGVTDVVHLQPPGGDVFREQPDIVENYRRVLNTLHDLAMTEAETVEWLRNRVIESRP